MTRSALAATLGAMLAVSPAAAQTPLEPIVTYQGELSQGGTPVTSADFRFRLYNAEVGGAQVGPELPIPDPPIAAGRFTVPLNFGSAAFGPDTRWLEIDVASPTGSPSYVTLAPRQKITGAPYAMYAMTAETASTAAIALDAAQFAGQPASYYTSASNLSSGTLGGGRLAGTYANIVNLSNAGNTFSGAFTGSGAGLGGLNASNLASGTLPDARLSLNVALRNVPNHFTGSTNSFTGSLGVGLTSPAYPLHALTGTADRALFADNSAPAGIGVYGRATGVPGFGVYGLSGAISGDAQGVRGESLSTSGRGVSGLATASAGVTYGVHGRSLSPSGFGVYGEAVVGVKGMTVAGAGTNGRGVYGFGPDGGIGVLGEGTTGVRGQGFSEGVIGLGPVRGVRGESDGTNGIGVFGSATAATGTTFGMRGLSSSTGGFGVVGDATSSTGSTAGVSGISSSTGGRGVWGVATAPTGMTHGVLGESSSTTGRGVSGSALAGTGLTYGVHGESFSSGGTGVFGNATALAGTTYGVRAQCASTAGRGVAGSATATTGSTAGVYGESASTAGSGVAGFASATSGITSGVYGQSASPDGYGVSGLATHASGPLAVGVLGQSNSTNGIGVYGIMGATTGVNFGVYGRSDSPSGFGLYGFNPATTGITRGVYGQSNSQNGVGVYGLAGSGSAAGVNYGVVGVTNNPATGFGMFCVGPSGGTIKSFRIDHPDDPANKYLRHYCHEGPEPQNVYNGIVLLDEDGEAWVTLPAYFARISRDPRYTLTAVGAPMPLLHIADEIDELSLSAGAAAAPGQAAPVCSFRIAGGAPGAKVSWRIDAIRNDAWVRAHGAPVEIEKAGVERGKYQHPELYAQPPEKGVFDTAGPPGARAPVVPPMADHEHAAAPHDQEAP